MKNKIKLNKKVVRACEIMESIVKLTKEFGDISNSLNSTESCLTGGMIVGIYSPVGDIGTIHSVGQKTICDGLLVRINEAKSRPDRPDMPEMFKDIFGLK